MTILDQLNRAAEAQAKTTPGPWEYDGNCGGYIMQAGDKIGRMYSNRDAPFIAAARSLPLAALARLVEAARWLSEVDQAYCLTFPGISGLWQMYQDELTRQQLNEVVNRERAVDNLRKMRAIAWKEMDSALVALEQEAENG